MSEITAEEKLAEIREYPYDRCDDLVEIINSNPDNEQIVNQAFSLFTEDLENKKGDLVSFYYPPARIVNSNPDNEQIVNQAFNVFTKGLETDENGDSARWNSDEAYKSLASMINSNPDNEKIVNQALNLFDKALCFYDNCKYNLEYACEAIATIAASNPDNKEITARLFSLLKKGLELGTNSRSYDERSNINKALASIAASNPNNKEITDPAFVLLKERLEQDKEGLSADIFFNLSTSALSHLSNKEARDRAFDVAAELLKKDDRHIDILGDAAMSFYRIVEADPNNKEITARVLDLLAIGMEHGDTERDDLSRVYYVLGRIASLGDKEINARILDLLAKGLKSDHNDGGCLSGAFDVLKYIASYSQIDKEMSVQIFDLLSKGLESNECNTDSLCQIYGIVAKIIASNPNNKEISTQALDLLDKSLKSKNNDSEQSTHTRRRRLDRGLRFHKNDYKSLTHAFSVLENIVASNPNNKEINAQVLKVVANVAESYNNESAFCREYYNILKSILKNRSDLTENTLVLTRIAATLEASEEIPSTQQLLKAAHIYDQPTDNLRVEAYRKICCAVIDVCEKHAEKIKGIPYKKMFFEALIHSDDAQEANFLDTFTDEIRNLAMDKYGQKDWYESISEAAKNPEYMKEVDGIWQKMMETPEKYATYKYNDHNNAYIREMFPEKVEQLHQFVETRLNEDFQTKAFYEILDYHKKVGQMQNLTTRYGLNGNAHFDLVNAGIDNVQDAKHCLDIWNAINKRPDRYGSPYNDYSIDQIAKIAKVPVKEPWMYAVMINAVEKGGLTLSGRTPSEISLFDACKAWKSAPAMPQRLAEKIGKHSIYGRMLAGSIFDMMSKDGNVSPKEWRENKQLQLEFYKELDIAEKMPRQKALKQYIPDTVINRKRLAGAVLNEAGEPFTREKVSGLYRQMEKHSTFENMLAKPGEEKMTVEASSRLEAAREGYSKASETPVAEPTKKESNSPIATQTAESTKVTDKANKSPIAPSVARFRRRVRQ